MADEKHQKKEELSIVRIAGKDINGSYAIPKALNQVKGIGINIAHAIALVAEREFGIKVSTEIGSLSDQDTEKLEGIITEPGKYGIPRFMLNRQRDKDTNVDMHLSGTDLMLRVKQDVEADVRVQSWRGYRHQYRQKVRGQRTRSTGRTGETIGVMKKSAQATATAAKAGEGKPAEKK